MDNEKSNLEIAMEFVGQHPDLVEHVNGEMFQLFWEHPVECIKQYNSTIEFMKTSFRIPDDVIESQCKDYLLEACKEVSNLMANNP